MAKLFDRVGQSTATTGTGTVTLGAVITDSTNGDLATFTDMGAVAGDSVNYLIVDGSNSEIGTGTLGGTGPGFTLTRTVSKSKISGTVGTTALTLSGTAKVYSVLANLAPGILNLGTTYHYGADTYDATNYSRLKITHAGGTAGATIATEAGGTGTAGDLTLTAGSNLVKTTGKFQFGASAGLGLSSTNNDFGVANNGSVIAVSMASTGIYAWAPSTLWYNAADTAIARNAAGVVEVNNGTAGAFRDLIARNVRTSATTVASLVAAATAGAGARSFVTDATATHTAGVGTVVAGSGSNAVPVYSDGTNWRIG